MKCTKAIIPVAGYGTRRLPITKAIEKCMLPVLNRPIVDYIVADCIKAGIRDFYFVTGEGSRQLESYYSHNKALERHLREHGKTNFLELITPPADCSFNFIIQPEDSAYGTSVPVWLARDVVEDLAEDEKVLVIMGDQFLFNADGTSETANFLAQAENAGAPSALLAVNVPKEEVSKYGIIATKPYGDTQLFAGIVEKPAPEAAPSTLNNASFYLFEKRFFEFLEADMAKPHSGEYMITDAINDYATAGSQLAVIENRGEYLDCGTTEGWLAANNRLQAATKK